jgi:hypothetical protein
MIRERRTDFPDAALLKGRIFAATSPASLSKILARGEDSSL